MDKSSIWSQHQPGLIWEKTIISLLSYLHSAMGRYCPVKMLPQSLCGDVSMVALSSYLAATQQDDNKWAVLVRLNIFFYFSEPQPHNTVGYTLINELSLLSILYVIQWTKLLYCIIWVSWDTTDLTNQSCSTSTFSSTSLIFSWILVILTLYT